MTIALDIITTAYQKANLFGLGETLDNATANFGLTIFNEMIDNWGAEGSPIYNLVDSQTGAPSPGFTLVPGQAAYTVGVGQLLNIRPPYFDNVYLTDGNNVSYYQDIIDVDEYSRLIYKVAPGRPYAVYINYAETTLTMTFYPTPAYNDNVHAVYGTALVQPITVNTAVTMPPGYLAAYSSNLAVLLANFHGKQVAPGLAAQADWTKRVVAMRNEQMHLLQNTMPTQKKRSFNILTGGTV